MTGPYETERQAAAVVRHHYGDSNDLSPPLTGE